MERIKTWWQSYGAHGNPDFILVQKLKLLKKDLTNWNGEVLGKVEARSRRLWKTYWIYNSPQNGKLNQCKGNKSS